MHPALSIIVFTTASGTGYGLAAMLGLGVLDPAATATKVAHVTALVLIGFGLVSSTLHLRNPQRAWRALSQWRSSWLSREGAMALLAFVPLLVSAWAAIFLDRYLPLAGLVGTAACIITVFCTAMIYASLKAVDAWHTRLTPASYLLFAAAAGLLLAAFFSAAAGRPNPHLLVMAIVFIAAAWAIRIRWRQRATTLTPLSNAETATGLGAIGTVRPFEPPHMMENYLTREMGFRVARKHADKLFGLAVLFGGALPTLVAIVLIVSERTAGIVPAAALAVAVASHMLGMLIERWLFFAEARHAVMNYYGR